MPWLASLAAARVPDAQLVGRRTSAAVLTAVYGIPLPFSGPRYASSTPGGGSAGALSATVSFVGLGPGNDGPLVVVEPDPIGPLANSSVCPVGVGAVLCQGFMIQVRGLRACVDCRVRSPAPLPLASTFAGQRRRVVQCVGGSRRVTPEQHRAFSPGGTEGPLGSRDCERVEPLAHHASLLGWWPACLPVE